ncbi:hypothetical protein B296_00025992, partial [Ensete ventricosum]
IRSGYTAGADVVYSLQDLQLGAKGALNELVPGRRCQTILGEQGSSLFHYKAVLLDSQQLSEPFLYHCGVFIVPKIFLDSSHTGASMDDIQKDLSPLVRNLAPREADDEARIPTSYFLKDEITLDFCLVVSVPCRYFCPIARTRYLRMAAFAHRPRLPSIVPSLSRAYSACSSTSWILDPCAEGVHPTHCFRPTRPLDQGSKVAWEGGTVSHAREGEQAPPWPCPSPLPRLTIGMTGQRRTLSDPSTMEDEGEGSGWRWSQHVGGGGRQEARGNLVF